MTLLSFAREFCAELGVNSFRVILWLHHKLSRSCRCPNRKQKGGSRPRSWLLSIGGDRTDGSKTWYKPEPSQTHSLAFSLPYWTRPELPVWRSCRKLCMSKYTFYSLNWDQTPSMRWRTMLCCGYCGICSSSSAVKSSNKEGRELPQFIIIGWNRKLETENNYKSIYRNHSSHICSKRNLSSLLIEKNNLWNLTRLKFPFSWLFYYTVDGQIFASGKQHAPCL